MKRKPFRELMSSVREAGRIRRGAARAARVTVIRGSDVNAARALSVPRKSTARKIRHEVADCELANIGRSISSCAVRLAAAPRT
jgi:hypothetical protein